jgi:hypothetical protein
MVSDLAKSLGGRIEYGFGTQFSSLLLVFPLTERERQANRVVASRRARGAQQRKAMPPLSRLQAASAHSDSAGSGRENPTASEPAADATVRHEMKNG